VKLHGATVHFVTTALDNGPVIVQGAVPVMPGDTEEELAARVLEVEHRIYPQAVRWLLEGRIEFVADVVQVRGTGVSADTMISPRNIE
jgi:phosphoribosylglycinamide formyltransferase-1